MKNEYDDICSIFKPTALDRRTKAEILTPIELAKTIIDKVPDAFWKAENTVFEPSCGKGVFLALAYDKFINNGFTKEIILTKLLHFADINPVNIDIVKLMLDPLNEYKLNSYTGNSLDLELPKFDLVIGNPPFDAPQKAVYKKRGGSSLWNKFVSTALNTWLKPNGYLAFITPAGWRKPSSKQGRYNTLFSLMNNTNTMLYLSINSAKDGKKMFNACTRFDWYLIQSVVNTGFKTKIDDELNVRNEIDLSKLTWLPNYNFDKVFKLLSTSNNLELIYSSSLYDPRKEYVSSVETNEFKYPLIHATNKKGIRYMYSKVNDKGHFGVSKVIFGDSGLNDVIIDLEGKYGLTCHGIGIKVSSLEEAKAIKKALLSDRFKVILKSCSFSNFMINNKMFTKFRKDFYLDFV